MSLLDANEAATKAPPVGRGSGPATSTRTRPQTPFDVRARSAPRRESRRLQWLVAILDGFAIFAVWGAVLVVWPIVSRLHRSALDSWIAVFAITALGITLFAWQELYRARVSNVRTLELTRIFRSVLLLTLLAVIGGEVIDISIGQREAVLAAPILLVVLVVFRGGFRMWLRERRRQGRFTRPVVIVGTNSEAAHLYSVAASHPESGITVTGVLGDADEATSNGLSHLYLGPISVLRDELPPVDLSAVLVAVSAVDTDKLNSVVRNLLRSGVHVQLTSGLRGIAFRRLRAMPLLHEPLFFVESAELATWQLATKRTIDIVGSIVALAISLPLIVLAAIAIKLTDRGPILYRQTRIGRNGSPFRICKLRTMVVDADTQIDLLAAENERSGPLFKLDRDPRFTRVGRFLDLTSINELPQLWNVLRGEMSLVGPRPALPSEERSFDSDLRARNLVRPGITGLWQVEARDNPQFSVYRRLDLFYVENWSVTLDLVILLQTLEVVVGRCASVVMSAVRPSSARAHGATTT